MWPWRNDGWEDAMKDSEKFEKKIKELLMDESETITVKEALEKAKKKYK